MFFFFLNQSYFRIILAVIEIEIEYLRFLVGDEGAKSCGGRKRKTNKSKLRWQSVKQCCRKTKNVTIKYLNIAPNFNVADSGIKKKKKIRGCCFITILTWIMRFSLFQNQAHLILEIEGKSTSTILAVTCSVENWTRFRYLDGTYGTSLKKIEWFATRALWTACNQYKSLDKILSTTFMPATI